MKLYVLIESFITIERRSMVVEYFTRSISAIAVILEMLRQDGDVRHGLVPVAAVVINPTGGGSYAAEY